MVGPFIASPPPQVCGSVPSCWIGDGERSNWVQKRVLLMIYSYPERKHGLRMRFWCLIVNPAFRLDEDFGYWVLRRMLRL
jgi:hypothetical protein